MFYLKKYEFRIQRINKTGKRLKAIRKNNIDKNKEKEGVLYEAGAFFT